LECWKDGMMENMEEWKRVENWNDGMMNLEPVFQYSNVPIFH
jgi:hypothetical protein